MLLMSEISLTIYNKTKYGGAKSMKDKYKGYYQEIGERIIFYRNIRRMTQQELAIKINCRIEYLDQIENYDVTSDFSWALDLLFAISDALEINVLIFLGCL